MARKRKPPAIKNATVVILPGIYNETLILLADAHNYFQQHGEEVQAGLQPCERTMFASEMSRITIRLSCVMAWLMARKALFSGKITKEAADTRYRLDCRDVALNQHIEAETILPDKMTDLLDRSFELYQRVARLDDQAHGPVAKNPKKPS